MISRRAGGAKAVPSNLPLALNLLQHKQLLVTLLTSLASSILLLSSRRRRPSESVLVRNDSDLFDLEGHSQGDGFEALGVPELHRIVSNLGLESRRHDDAIRRVDLDDLWDRRRDESVPVGVEEGLDGV